MVIGCDEVACVSELSSKTIVPFQTPAGIPATERVHEPLVARSALCLRETPIGFAGS